MSQSIAGAIRAESETDRFDLGDAPRGAGRGAGYLAVPCEACSISAMSEMKLPPLPHSTGHGVSVSAEARGALLYPHADR